MAFIQFGIAFREVFAARQDTQYPEYVAVANTVFTTYKAPCTAFSLFAYKGVAIEEPKTVISFPDQVGYFVDSKVTVSGSVTQTSCLSLPVRISIATVICFSVAINAPHIRLIPFTDRLIQPVTQSYLLQGFKVIPAFISLILWSVDKLIGVFVQCSVETRNIFAADSHAPDTSSQRINAWMQSERVRYALHGAIHASDVIKAMHV